MMLKFDTLIQLIVFLIIATSECLSLYCKDENGNNVDWYILYKLPFLQSDESPLNTGFSYASLSGPSVESLTGDRLDELRHWYLSKHLIKDSQSFLGQTLDPVYSLFSRRSKSNEISFVMYNDSPPPDSGN